MWNLLVFFCALGSLMGSVAFANILLIGSNVTLSFDSIAANFARPVKESGEPGILFLASPLDACSRLINSSIGDGVSSPYLLIVRGGCGFEDKVRRAQAAGFKAAIVYNNDDTNLVSMAGDSTDIDIHAVFVSKDSGLKLRKYVGVNGIQVWLLQKNENSAWSIMALAFLSLLGMSAILATCFFVRKHRIRQERPRASLVREFHGMSRRLVKAMPSLVFTEVLEDTCTSATCAICLDDYNVGDKIRILPCHHKFHTFCVDAWLTSWRTFCPICKRDARTTINDPPASEHTPLISSTPSSLPALSLPTSRGSSYTSSTPMQIRHSSPSYIRSIPNTPENHNSFQSYRESLYPTSSSNRSRASHLITSNSIVCPSFSPLNSIYMSFYSSPGNASSSYVRSSSRQPCPLRHSESAGSFLRYGVARSPQNVDRYGSIR